MCISADGRLSCGRRLVAVDAVADRTAMVKGVILVPGKVPRATEV